MVMSCEQVWEEISNYVDNEVDPALRAAMEEHLRGCQHCTAVLDGTRNVVTLYADGRVFDLPAGFSQRVQKRLAAEAKTSRGSFYGWLLAAAAALVLSGSFLIGNIQARSRAARSEHSEQASGIPGDMMVLVSEDGKTFHKKGCPFLHEKEKARLIAASEAIHEGYVPCVRCMRQYLRR